jgi:hypothetical protein
MVQAKKAESSKEIGTRKSCSDSRLCTSNVCWFRQLARPTLCIAYRANCQLDPYANWRALTPEPVGRNVRAKALLRFNHAALLRSIFPAHEQYHGAISSVVASDDIFGPGLAVGCRALRSLWLGFAGPGCRVVTQPPGRGDSPGGGQVQVRDNSGPPRPARVL